MGNNLQEVVGGGCYVRSVKSKEEEVGWEPVKS